MPSLETAQARGETPPAARRAGAAVVTPGCEAPLERFQGPRKVTCDSERMRGRAALASRRGFGDASIEHIETS